VSMRRTCKFKKGDLVRVDRDWDYEGGGYKYYTIINIHDFIGNEYIVGKVDIEDGGCYLDTTGWWFPESVLTMVKPFKPEFGYMLRLVQFRNDGSQSYVKDVGQLITEDEFEYLWDEYIEK